MTHRRVDVEFHEYEVEEHADGTSEHRIDRYILTDDEKALLRRLLEDHADRMDAEEVYTQAEEARELRAALKDDTEEDD